MIRLRGQGEKEGEKKPGFKEEKSSE